MKKVVEEREMKESRSFHVHSLRRKNPQIWSMEGGRTIEVDVVTWSTRQDLRVKLL